MTILTGSIVTPRSNNGLQLTPTGNGDSLDLGQGLKLDTAILSQELPNADIFVPFVRYPSVDGGYRNSPLSWANGGSAITGHVDGGVDPTRVIEDLNHPDNGVAFGLWSASEGDVVAWFQPPGENWTAYDTNADG